MVSITVLQKLTYWLIQNYTSPFSWRKLCLANVCYLPRLGTTYPYSIANDETVCVLCQHNTGIWKKWLTTVKGIEFLSFCWIVK